jgi:hypothetical protein
MAVDPHPSIYPESLLVGFSDPLIKAVPMVMYVENGLERKFGRPCIYFSAYLL